MLLFITSCQLFAQLVFVVYKESCYYINKEMHDSWNNSRKFCQSLGADLAVIKSFDENKFLLDKLLKKSKQGHGMDWVASDK